MCQRQDKTRQDKKKDIFLLVLRVSRLITTLLQSEGMIQVNSISYTMIEGNIYNNRLVSHD